MSTLDAVRSAHHAHVLDLQDRIVAALHHLDPGLTVVEEAWTRTDHVGQPGGGGRTRALTGDVIENGGVNVSCVHGALDPAFATQLGGAADDPLWAAGISLILHPRNPRVPTTHANFRMVSVGDRVWFGGGADLTPYYPHTEDFRHFHQVWRDATEPLGTWEAWKAWCDRYFTNPHREGEMRGVGGIFFDHWSTGDLEADAREVRRLSESFLPSWLPIAERRVHEPFSEADEQFMLHRRGRYVEFNLLHDRGTKFGLQTKGRTASILVSLPARVQFGYNWAPPPNTVHAGMMAHYWPRDWVGRPG